MGFAIEMKYVPCGFGIHAMSRAYFVAKVFHSACPKIILAEVESEKFVYTLTLPDWVRQKMSIDRRINHEFSIGEGLQEKKFFCSMEEYSKQKFLIMKKVADKAIEIALANLKELKEIPSDE